MAISEAALYQLGADNIVPGILGFKSDYSPAGPFPLPQRCGAICEPCWLEDGQVRAVGLVSCRHAAVRRA